MTIDVGSKAPSFNLPTDGDGTLKSTGLKGQAYVLYFYPKDDTSGCTKESIAFRDLEADFNKAGYRIIGISKDPVKKHDKFKEKYDLPFTLLSDEDCTLCDAYGVWKEKSMYGRKYMGIERSTFVIDAKGKVTHVWRKVKVTGHAEAVLDAVTA